tara:strand:- start:180 stop:578 length:399 start_codon:yes stop_codon:yes gene_type:complete
MLSNSLRKGLLQMNNSHLLVRHFCSNPKLYTRTHEWVQYDQESKIATIGITDVAQRELGELVHVALPEVGEEYSVKSIVSTVESAKSAADVYNIVDGEVIEVNSKLSEDATIVNDDAEGAGWIMKVKVEYPW